MVAPTAIMCLPMWLLSLHLFSSNATEFNVFKSYQHANVKPKQYSTGERVRRDVSEYLTRRQVDMMRLRRGKEKVPGAMFDENWSGFKTDRSRPPVARRLADLLDLRHGASYTFGYMWFIIMMVSLCVIGLAVWWAAKRIQSRRVT